MHLCLWQLLPLGLLDSIRVSKSGMMPEEGMFPVKGNLTQSESLKACETLFAPPFWPRICRRRSSNSANNTRPFFTVALINDGEDVYCLLFLGTCVFLAMLDEGSVSGTKKSEPHVASLLGL